jgi:hypothetical protein
LLRTLVHFRSENQRPLRGHRWRRRSGALLSAAAILVTFAAPAAAEVWKDASGQFQVEAEFLGIRGADVYLKKPSGMTIKVPLARLSEESQQLARQLAMPKAPATPAAADAPDAAARALLASLEAGNLRALWDALPSGYQRDVNDLIHTFAANMDADVWKAGAGVVLKAVRVLKEKKEFILAQPALAQSPVNAATMTENWDPLVGVLDTIATSDIADLEKLKTIEVGAFLDGTGKKVAEQLTALAKAADDKKLSLTDFPGVPVDAMPLAGIAKAKFSTVKMEGDTATLRVDNEGKTEDHEVVRVDGKWLPKQMVDQWSAQVQAGKTALTTQMPESLKKNKLQMILPMQMVSGVLDQLLAAKTQPEFDQVIQQVMQTFAPQPAGGGPGVPPGAPKAGLPGPGTSPPGAPKPSADPFGR